MSSSQRVPNRDVILRLAYVIERGSPQERNAANARASMLKEAYRLDREFPSPWPLVAQVETEIWNWWHKLMAQSDVAKDLKAPPVPPARPVAG
jgi:hypothetical protein